MNPAWPRLPALAERFRRAKPFPHVIVDGFLEPGLCAGLEAEFPAYDVERFRNEYGHPGKAAYPDVRRLGPAFRALDDLARSRVFLTAIEELTGVRGLLHDPDYLGAGAQENMRDMRLWPHVDFNVHPATGWRRRVNVLLYLNRDWNERMGGRLCLHGGPRDARPPVKTLPLFNRCVIFLTTRRSWHSVEPVRSQDPARGRRSVSMYFFTKPRRGERLAAHSTLWEYPRLPEAVRAGAVLDAGLLEQINRALALRDIELARLDRVRADSWRSPLPEAWGPGYRLTAADCRLLGGELSARQRRLEDFWWRRDRRLDEAVRLIYDGKGSRPGRTRTGNK